jgi:hypothetical protein
MGPSLNTFENLTYPEMRYHLRQYVKIPSTLCTKTQLVAEYTQYLLRSADRQSSSTRQLKAQGRDHGLRRRRTENDDMKAFRQKLVAFHTCNTDDLVCLMSVLGIPKDTYDLLLNVDCTKICQLQAHLLPLAIVSDPDTQEVVAIQTSDGVVPITRALVTGHTRKPLIYAPPALLKDLREAIPLGKKKTKRVLGQLPTTDMITIRKVGEGLLFAIQTGTDPGHSKRLPTVFDRGKDVLFEIIHGLRTFVPPDDSSSSYEEDDVWK